MSTPPPLYPEDRPPTIDERRAFWDHRYADQGWVFGLEPNQFVAEFFAEQPPGRVLDLGCGQGRNAIWLAQRGFDVLAVDLSEVAVRQAAELAADAGVTAAFEAHDLAVWRPTGTFDYVVMSYLQVREADRRTVHAMAKDAVEPGGLVFLIAHHLDNLERGYGGPQLPEVLFTQTQLEDDFTGFDVVRSEMVERLVHTEEGPQSAIDVLYIGRKP